jgi:hypothetical protein
MKYSKHERYLAVEYQAYKLMKKRCYNQRDPHYKYYGGRGITVCPRWLVGEDDKTGAECFLGDMGPRPPGLTLQRIDREANYCPENCRWAPLTRPRKRFVVLSGKTLPLAQVAQMVGLKLQTLVSRLRSGMVLEEAIARPPTPRRTRGVSKSSLKSKGV